MPSDRRHEAVEGGVRCGQCGEEWDTPLGAARCCEMEIVTDGGVEDGTEGRLNSETAIQPDGGSVEQSGGIVQNWEDVLERWQARHNSRVRHIHSEGIELAGGENQSVREVDR